MKCGACEYSRVTFSGDNKCIYWVNIGYWYHRSVVNLKEVSHSELVNAWEKYIRSHSKYTIRAISTNITLLSDTWPFQHDKYFKGGDLNTDSVATAYRCKVNWPRPLNHPVAVTGTRWRDLPIMSPTIIASISIHQSSKWPEWWDHLLLLLAIACHMYWDILYQYRPVGILVYLMYVLFIAMTNELSWKWPNDVSPAWAVDSSQ